MNVTRTALVIGISLVMLSHVAAQPPHRVVISAGTVVDGRGNVVRNTRIVVEGTRIVSLDPTATPVDYDLSHETVMPGVGQRRRARGEAALYTADDAGVTTLGPRPGCFQVRGY